VAPHDRRWLTAPSVKKGAVKLAYFGLLRRRECWVPTGYGWTTFVIGVIITLVFGINEIYSFLTVNAPIPSEILVVEGWLPDYALEQARNEFNSHSYRLLITTGERISKGHYLSEYKTFAELSAATLRRLGMNEQSVVAVPVDFAEKDRTYECALAVRDWLSGSGLSVKSINVCTIGPHARRSRLLFTKAFGDTIAVGVIALDDIDYDPHRWWKSSEGVKTIIEESVGYLYARFSFYPNRAK
jgi:DUF218 domain